MRLRTSGALTFISFVVAAAINTTAVFAKESICDNLQAYTCAQGQSNDGTGVAATEDPDTKELIRLGRKFKTEANRKIREAVVADPSFRDAVIKGLNLENSILCQAPTSKACLKTLASGSAEVVYDSLYLSEEELAVSDQAITGTPGPGKFLDARYLAKYTNLTALRHSLPIAKLKEQFGRELQRRFISPEAEGRIENDLLPNVKQVLLDKIDEYVTDKTERQKLRNRIEAIGVARADCLDFTKGVTVPELNLRNAQYFSNTKKLKIYCGFARSGVSEFTLVNTLAHEMTHAIAPCALASGKAEDSIKYDDKGDQSATENAYPIKGIVSCLRNEKSVNAKNWLLEKYKSEHPEDVEHVKYKFSFCGEDQLTEVIPDWMAVEVLTEYMNRYHRSLSQDHFRTGYANVWKIGCHQKAKNSSVSPPSHPDLEHRVNALLLVNPGVRRQMGCVRPPKRFSYCAAQTGNGDPVTSELMAPGSVK